ncbi:MAG: VWA domain-containing protein [Chloroflexi bacterium]|nr:VWA domain-containing protein [Chloroflexota bacterium]
MTSAPEISRANPASFLFLIDQSGSMQYQLAGQADGDSKMKAAADAVNRTIQAIAMRCSQGEEVRDYFHIGVIGYKTDSTGNPILQAALSGTTVEEPYMSISDVVEIATTETRPIKESDGAGGLVVVDRTFAIWVQPEAQFGTPMSEAFHAAHKAIKARAKEYGTSYPPILINISDGEPSDGKPTQTASEIMEEKTVHGNALIFNIHLSDKSAIPIAYPSTAANLDAFGEMLFEMSSKLPPMAVEAGRALEITIPEDARGYVYNSNMESLVQFLEIGTRAGNLS